ncbi:MAG: LPS translocon maturation chaperone LptM [Methylophagaceae bacterium]
MKKVIICRRVAAVICLVLLATACGQKGDLYLPEGNALISWVG